MTTVGIIANPAAGKDIRRLVAQGRVVSNQEKVNIVRRVFAGLAASGVERVLVMPDTSGLARLAISDWKGVLDARYLDMEPTGSQRDSTRAAELMRDADVSCIVTLGGDGTNRVVAKGAGDVPLVPVSTGTNNVFPQMVEGTLAGLAAGAVATGAVALEQVSRRSKKLNVLIDGEVVDIALVDAAVSRQMFVGARAIWEPELLDSMFLTRAEPASIGLSSIGARLRPVSMDEPRGLYLRFAGEPDETQTTVHAPVAPGVVSAVRVASWGVMEPGERYTVTRRPGTVALDGEREIELLKGRAVEIVLDLNGPLVVDIVRTLETLAGAAR